MAARVLVTDGEQRAVLAACRGLARAGYRVAAAAVTRPAAAHWSRSVSERWHVPDPRVDEAAFAARLAEIVAAGRYDVVLPGTDVSLLAVSGQRERFEHATLLGLPPHATVERSVDKVALLEASTEVGLAPPPSVVCASAADAAAAAEELGYPLALKPARSFVPSRDGLVQRTTAIVPDRRTLEQVASELEAPFIAQRLEREPAIVSFSGVAAGGRLAAVAVARYRRTWPASAGSAAFAETVAPPAGLTERVEELLARLGWQGIFELELFDQGEGRLAAVDFNPRVFGWMALAVAAGANLPAVWCDRLLGRDGPPAIARPGVAYRWEEGDLRHLVRRLGEGRLGAAAAVLRPRRHVVHAHFRLDDPAPLAARPVWLLRRALRL
jgi:predicted ATP-grasp superfamily ATP-dependent carboligase